MSSDRRIILVPIDFSPVSEAVIALASEEARASNGRLHLIHVSRRSESLSAFDREKQDMEALVAECRREGIQVESEVTHGDPCEEVLSAIERLKPALVVVGSHGHGAVYGLVAGSVAEALLRKSTCPVLVAPPATHKR